MVNNDVNGLNDSDDGGAAGITASVEAFETGQLQSV